MMRESFESEPRLTPAQVDATMRRAMELQAALEAEVPAGEVGVGQLVQAAEEAGLQPDLVRRAAQEVLQGTQPGVGEGWGTKGKQILVDRIVSESIREPEWPAVLNLIRDAAGVTGTWASVEGGFKWTGPDSVVVKITPFGEKTRIEIQGFHHIEGCFVGMIVAGVFPLALFFAAPPDMSRFPVMVYGALLMLVSARAIQVRLRRDKILLRLCAAFESRFGR